VSDLAGGVCDTEAEGRERTIRSFVLLSSVGAENAV
jgi:hypothetical protein